MTSINTQEDNSVEASTIESVRQAVVRDGVDVLLVNDLTESDLGAITWSGSASHVRAVQHELERAKAGLVEYLAVRSSEGYPVAIGGIDYQREPGCGYLFQLATHERLRGLGLGTRLIQTAERRMTARGCRWSLLAVEKENPRAKQLYDRLGYEAYDEGKDSWKQVDSEGRETIHTADVVLMKKKLGE